MTNTSGKSPDILVAGCFAGMGAPFAVHPNDRKRAALYLQYLVGEQKTWADAEIQIREYLGSGRAGWPVKNIEDEVKRAKKLIKPWLE